MSPRRKVAEGGAAEGSTSPPKAAAAPRKAREPRPPLPFKYERVLPFNPHSSEQVKALIRSLGLTVPKSSKGEDKETTEAKYLRRFGRKHLVFKQILACRERAKLLTTYNWPLKATVSSATVPLEVLIGEPRLQQAVSDPAPQNPGHDSGATRPILEGTVSEGQAPPPTLGEAVPALAQTDVQPRVSPEAPHSLHVRGSWVGETPCGEEVSKVWEEVPSREAVHPSLGLGSVQQLQGESAGRLYFVPQQVSHAIEGAGPFILPFERTTTEHRVRTNYGFAPSTWRKSSRAVNLQNIPKRSDLSREFRRMLVATPGHLLIEADASAIEAVLVGYCAGSNRYIQLAKSGVHGFLTSHIVGAPVSRELPPDEFTKACKATKRAYPGVYETAKRIVHLSNYMGTPRRIYDEYEEEFDSLRQVTELQQLYYALIPDVVKWQHDVCSRAAKEKYLQNHFGYRHYFYNVFGWDRKYSRPTLGDDAKRAVAFIPQSDASAIQSELLLRLDAYKDIRETLRLIIHDSVVFEVPEWQVDYVCSVVYREMTAGIPELGGLSIGCNVSYGPSLGDMVEWLP